MAAYQRGNSFSDAMPPPPVDDRDPKDEAPDPNASPYKGMQSLGSGDGGFPQFYKRPNDDFVTLGHDPPPDGAIAAEEPPAKPCFQIKRRRDHDKMMKKSKDGVVIMAATTAWDLYFAIPWFDALAHEEDTVAHLCKVDLDSSFTEFILDKYDCQYRPTYFYIKDGEVVDTTLGDTETTEEYLTHWAKHGRAKEGLKQTEVPDFLNMGKEEEGDDDEAATTNGADSEPPPEGDE